MLKTQIRIDEMKDCAKITKHRQIINSKFSNIAKNMCLKARKSFFYSKASVMITINSYFFVQIFSVL
jgi:chorismate-pyruvate lyase